MKARISKEKLLKYLSTTAKALDIAKKALDEKRLEDAEDFLDMASRYYSDALYYHKKGEYVTAFAAVNYAHGWLDAGARIGLFKVKDSKLFTVDDD
ncbi:DUF357 domain-containing protein [Candidatus Woesearchaeota archaeon]|nr:DUF357 domain-containing protein [Candidatus Woesearchaeota archaeon]